MQSKVLSVKLIAGDHPIKLEWMQASGASQVSAPQVALEETFLKHSPCSRVGLRS